jgi:hypothetical protein
MYLRRGCHLAKSANHVQARTRVKGGTRCVAPSGESLVGRRYERRAAVVAASDYQSRHDIATVLASKKLGFSLEYRPQADTGLQPTIIEQEGGSRDSVCADDPLVAVHSQQHARCALLCWRDRHDPLVTKMLSE